MCVKVVNPLGGQSYWLYVKDVRVIHPPFIDHDQPSHPSNRDKYPLQGELTIPQVCNHEGIAKA